MLEVTRYEGRRRVRGSITLTVLVGLFAALVVSLFPSIVEAGESIEAYVESLPPAVREGFVGTVDLTTVEGFLAAELYQFLWVIMLALYAAYVAGGLVAGDVETGRIDLVLATPVSRARIVVEKYLSLLVPVAVVNLATPFLVFGGVTLIDESLDPVALFALHVLAVPYLLSCAAVGLVMSVALDRAGLAQRGGLAVVFGLFMLDAVTADTDVEWLGLLSPSRYYDPVAILTEETYDLLGSGLLLAASLWLVLISIAVFERRDL
jgi:ABC-2 type transport system permease protein